MIGLRVDKKARKLNLNENPMPELVPGEDDDKCVIRVHLSGVCGTDIHIIQDKFNAKDGVILGHEFVGVVYEVSKSEEILKVGDRVAVNPNLTCGICMECRRGYPNYCTAGQQRYTVGIVTDGGWAQFCKVRTSLVYKLADSLQFEQAVLVEPLSCILHGLDIIPPFRIGQRILIMGAGIIGLLWSSLIHHMGHREVYVVQTSPTRRKNFSNLDLGYEAISWDDIENSKSICEWNFDVVIDTSGNPEAMAKAMPLFRNGGVLIIFGVADPSKNLTINPFHMYQKEISIFTCCINTHTSFQKALDCLAAMGDKYFTMEKLNMKSFSLNDHEKALKDLHDRKYTKIVFDCTK